MISRTHGVVNLAFARRSLPYFESSFRPRIGIVVVLFQLSVQAEPANEPTTVNATLLSTENQANKRSIEGDRDRESAESAKDRARAHFHRGVRLYGEGNASAAYVEFERAYQESPHYRVLYNIGLTAHLLHYDGDALRAFEGFLSQGGENISESLRKDALFHLEQLRQSTGAIIVKCLDVESDIWVSSRVLGRCPSPAPIVVSAGRHTVAIETESGRKEVRVDVGVGERLKLTFRQSERVTSPPMASATESVISTPPALAIYPAPLRPVNSSARSRGFWWGLGVGGVLGVAGTTTGILALSQSSQATEQANSIPADPERLASLNATASALALSTDLLLGAAVLTVATTFIFEFALPSGDAQPAQGGAQGARTLQMVVLPQELRLRGVF